MLTRNEQKIRRHTVRDTNCAVIYLDSFTAKFRINTDPGYGYPVYTVRTVFSENRKRTVDRATLFATAYGVLITLTRFDALN